MAYLKAPIAMTLGVYTSRSFTDCFILKWDDSKLQDFYWQACRAVPLQ